MPRRGILVVAQLVERGIVANLVLPTIQSSPSHWFDSDPQDTLTFVKCLEGPLAQLRPQGRFYDRGAESRPWRLPGPLAQLVRAFGC